MHTLVLVLGPFVGFGAVFVLASGVVLLSLKLLGHARRESAPPVDDGLFEARVQLAAAMASAVPLDRTFVDRVPEPATVVVPVVAAAAPATASTSPAPAGVLVLDAPVERTAASAVCDAPADLPLEVQRGFSLGDLWRGLVPHVVVARAVARCLLESRRDHGDCREP